jgi:hypothetical protein
MDNPEYWKKVFTEAIGLPTSFSAGFNERITKDLEQYASGLNSYLNANGCEFEKSYTMTIKENDYYTVIFKVKHNSHGSIFPRFSIPIKLVHYSQTNKDLIRIWTKGPFQKYVWSTLDLIVRSKADPYMLYLYFQEKFDDVKLGIEKNIINSRKSTNDDIAETDLSPYKNFPFPLPL